MQLRRRFNLVENLVTTVKAYASHETELLEKITNLRTSVRSDDPEVRGKAEAQVSGALANIFAVAEGYPELKADQNFLQLQTELSDIEDHIQKSRRYYNGAVRDFNIACETFPLRSSSLKTWGLSLLRFSNWKATKSGSCRKWIFVMTARARIGATACWTAGCCRACLVHGPTRIRPARTTCPGLLRRIHR